MAANVTIIGKTTRVRGRVTGAVDLEVQGYVEGDIAVGGDVTIDAHGIVGAGVRGRRLLVRGAVKGDLVGEESILLEAGARVLGDVRAPRVAIALGALVRGHVQTGDPDAAGARSARVQTAARPVVAAPPAGRPAHAANPVVVAPQKAVATAPSKVARPEPPPAARAAASAAPRRPPPPVVPALRSAKGQIAKKKER
jgi:cytoskeletal protein CcmA (bactofilin family)